MLIDARTVPRDSVVETDVCIVGAGAAGITLALELIGTPLRVHLLESGGLDFDAATQQLYQGETDGHPYYPLDTCRLRYFGGSTNHWAGWSSPIDPLDFTPRPWVPHSGWPFGREHLDRYYREAQMLCQLGPFSYEARDWTEPGVPPLPLKRVVSRVEQLSPPTRFGVEYRDKVLNADNINTCVHANVTQIETNQDACPETHFESRRDRSCWPAVVSKTHGCCCQMMRSPLAWAISTTLSDAISWNTC